jgi:hypothetical protein
MRLTTLLTSTVLGLAISSNILAQDVQSASGEVTEKCTYPTQPTIPNGKGSTEAELIASQRNMKAYLVDGDEFIACLHRVEESWSDEEKEEKASFVVMFHNRMVDDMEEVADVFNAAVRAFKGSQ